MISAEYLAGFTDGEGYIALGKIPRRTRSTEYPVRLVVYNTDDRVLEGIHRAWGGTLSYSKSRNPRWKPQVALIWTNAAAASVLVEIAPYLRVKSRQAAIALDYHAHVMRCRRIRDRRGRLLPLSNRETKVREAVHRCLKSLNAPGARFDTLSRSARRSERSRRQQRAPVSAEYLAGLLDGEGSLMITKWKGKASWKPQYRARISVSNTDRAVLMDVQRSFGGILANQPPRDPGWKYSYQLVWTGGMAEPFLRCLLPYLQLKRERAEVLLEFVRHQRRTQHGRLSDEVIALREGLRRRIRELNARGAIPITPART